MNHSIDHIRHSHWMTDITREKRHKSPPVWMNHRMHTLLEMNGGKTKGVYGIAVLVIICSSPV
jgi:hypothetical protein